MDWRIKNIGYDESRGAKLAQWRAAHPQYWREWRAQHPGYVERNRQGQKWRDATKRGVLAKQNEWTRFTDGKYRGMILAKQNDMARSGVT
ncbi:MAG: hypothetical protein IPN19_05710 [Elusimicrobia bacterium]|nr:hypothetical protein [Elusimicrobiota bacterium]